MKRRGVAAVLLAAGCGGAPTAKPGPTVETASPAAAAWERTAPPEPLAPDPAARVTPKITDTVLSNGLRVVVVENHRQAILSVRVIFGQGSAADPKDALGATFFAVSLLAGYHEVNRDDIPIIEADSFARRVFYTGGQVDLSVDAHQASFGIDGYAKDLRLYLEMLSQAIRNPRCGPRSFRLRRNAMIHALEEVELSDQQVFSLFLNRAAFGAGHPYARPAFGTIASLKKLERWRIQERQKDLLKPNGTTLLVVGDVQPREVLYAVRTTFANWAKRAPVKSARVQEPPVDGTNRVFLIPRRPARSMLVCATRALHDVRAEEPAVQVLTEILGGGLDSRLGNRLRTERGFAYGVQASILKKRHADALVACTQTRTEDTSEVVQIFSDVLKSLRAEPPSAQELLRAKARLAAAADAGSSGTIAIVKTWLTALELNHGRPRNDRAFMDVTPGEIQAAAEAVLKAEHVRFVLGGPTTTARDAARTAGLTGIRTVRLDL